MAAVMRSPRGGKIKRSYLDKGPTKEQKDRRNFLKGKLGFDGLDDPSESLDEDSGDFMPLAHLEGSPRRSMSTRQRLSRSLSPKNFGKRVLGERALLGGRRERPKKTVEPEEPQRILVRSKSNAAVHPNGRSRPEEAHSSAPKRRSKSNASAHPNGRPRPQESSSSAPKTRSKSNGSAPPNGRPRPEDSYSLSPARTRLRVLSGLSRSERAPDLDLPVEGFDNMRKSLMADKKHLDDLQSRYETDSDTEPLDNETLLERVARRVAERRGKMARANTDGENLASMQDALRRRQEIDHDQDEQIGGLWAMGLKALERVYDDLNS